MTTAAAARKPHDGPMIGTISPRELRNLARAIMSELEKSGE